MSDPCDGADYKVLWQQMQGRAEAAEAEVERLKGESASVSRTCGHLSDLATWWVERAEAAEAEVARLRWQVEQADIDIKALGFEAHPAVLMRMDRLVRTLRGEGEK